MIARLIQGARVAVALTSGPGPAEVEVARRIASRVEEARAGRPILNLIGQTSLADLAALLERAVLFLGVDSAPMHMATALGVPVVALFGPSGERSWGPWGDGHVVVTSPYLCRPCGQDGCLGSKRSDCLEALSAQTVWQASWTKRVNGNADASELEGVSHTGARQALLEPDTEDNLQRLFYDRGWTDGLPIVLPTEERVERMLAGTSHARDEVVGEVGAR
ncbi:MAG: glycosyltransferase family 9 protein, partial [Acidobacteriia bacterium]|nr:glycosyltransferase family 9 protein [Terriglobia bacterium]